MREIEKDSICGRGGAVRVVPYPLLLLRRPPEERGEGGTGRSCRLLHVHHVDLSFFLVGPMLRYDREDWYGRAPAWRRFIQDDDALFEECEIGDLFLLIVVTDLKAGHGNCLTLLTVRERLVS